MGKPSENVRFLDDVDMTFSLDSRTSSSQQLSSMEATITPIVFRASYRDINLIMSIVNSAIERYGQSQKQTSSTSPSNGKVQSLTSTSSPRKQSKLRTTGTATQTSGHAQVIMTKERVRSLIRFRPVTHDHHNHLTSSRHPLMASASSLSETCTSNQCSISKSNLLLWKSRIGPEKYVGETCHPNLYIIE